MKKLNGQENGQNNVMNLHEPLYSFSSYQFMPSLVLSIPLPPTVPFIRHQATYNHPLLFWYH